MALNNEQLLYFKDCYEEIYKIDKIKQMDAFYQHGNVTCLRHSVFVAYISYSLAIKLGLKVDYKSLIRGALLHDFFLYDWKTENMNPAHHLRIHPHVALENAMAYFPLNKVEQDIIVKHMWPIGYKFPKYLESYIVSIADKSCASVEFLNIFTKPKELATILS